MLAARWVESFPTVSGVDLYILCLVAKMVVDRLS